MSENDSSAMGEAIMIARGMRGWSAHELGERIGVPATTIRAWEQGIATPDPDIIPVLAEMLELDAGDLIERPAAIIDAPDADASLVLSQVPDSVPGPAPTAPSEADRESEIEAASPASAEVASDEALSWSAVREARSSHSSPGTVQTLSSTPNPYPVRADEPASVEAAVAPAQATATPADPLELVTRAATWVRDRWWRRRLLARAPTQMRSYVEDDRQSTTYRIRQVLTGVVLIVLVLLLRWAWTQFAEAVSTLFDTLRSAV